MAKLIHLLTFSFILSLVLPIVAIIDSSECRRCDPSKCIYSGDPAYCQKHCVKIDVCVGYQYRVSSLYINHHEAGKDCNSVREFYCVV